MLRVRIQTGSAHVTSLLLEQYTHFCLAGVAGLGELLA